MQSDVVKIIIPGSQDRIQIACDDLTTSRDGTIRRNTGRSRCQRTTRSVRGSPRSSHSRGHGRDRCVRPIVDSKCSEDGSEFVASDHHLTSYYGHATKRNVSLEVNLEESSSCFTYIHNVRGYKQHWWHYKYNVQRTASLLAITYPFNPIWKTIADTIARK